MKCPKCGKPIEKGQERCTRCGARVPTQAKKRSGAPGVVAVVLILLLLCAAGILLLRLRHTAEAPSPEPGTEMAEEAPSAEPSAPTATPSPEELYAPVLEAYRDYERRGGGLENWYGEEEDNLVHAGLTGVTRVGVQYRDLDHDGVPELIIAPYYTAEEYAASDWLRPGDYSANIVMDLYTLRDGKPVHVLLSGDRYRHTLTTDGHIYYSGSGGAAYSDACLYDFVDGELKFLEGVCIDGSEDRTFQLNSDGDSSHESDTPISYEEYQLRMQRLFRYTEDLLEPLELEPLTP